MSSAIASANKKGIQLTPQEMSLILDILKEGRPANEQEQIDQMVQMIRAIQAGKQPPGTGRR